MAETLPAADADGEGARPGRLTRFFDGPLGELLKQCRNSFVLVAILTSVTEVLALAPIVFMLNLFDRVIPSRSGVTLVSLLIIVVAVYLFWSALDWVRSQLMIRISLRMDWDVAASVFDAAFRRYLLQKQVNVHQVLGDLLKLRQFLTGEPLLALLAAPFSIVFALVAFVFHPWLGVFITVSMLLMVVAAWITKQLASPILRTANDASAEASRLAAQSLRNAEAALALGMQASIRRQWHERHQRFLELQVAASEAAGVLGGMTKLLTRMLPSLTFAFAVWLAISGEVTNGMVIAATFILARALSPLRTVLMRWEDIVGGRQAYDHLSRLLAADERYAEMMPLPAPKGELRVKELSVRPPNAKDAVLHNVSLSVDPGEALAVLGPSASGKSTLVRALIGLWPPQAGSVRLDGAEVSEWLRGELGPHVGYVPQEFEFFEGTVAQNVARLEEVRSDKVIAATRLIGLHTMILGFPKGYETKLGEQKHPLTGGQKQRLAIARALYGSPRYLVMDEPDASLDEAGQRALVQAIREAKQGGTTVVFTTHRPELLHVADRILILAEGRVQWSGTSADFRTATRQAVTRLAAEGGGARPVGT